MHTRISYRSWLGSCPNSRTKVAVYKLVMWNDWKGEWNLKGEAECSLKTVKLDQKKGGVAESLPEKGKIPKIYLNEVAELIQDLPKKSWQFSLSFVNVPLLLLEYSVRYVKRPWAFPDRTFHQTQYYHAHLSIQIAHLLSFQQVLFPW